MKKKPKKLSRGQAKRLREENIRRAAITRGDDPDEAISLARKYNPPKINSEGSPAARKKHPKASKLRREIADRERKLRALIQEREDLLLEVDRLAEEKGLPKNRQKRFGKLRTAESTENSLKKKIRKKNREIKRASKQVPKSSQVILELQGQLQDFNEQLERVRADIRQHKHSVSELLTKFGLAQKKAQLDSQIRGTESEVKKAQARLKKYIRGPKGGSIWPVSGGRVNPR